MPRPSCSIIIPSWNGRPLLERCLPGVLDAIDMAHDEVIVVDDGSTDDTCVWIRTHYPAVVLERLPRNSGYGAACNAGVAQSQSDIVCLLNNDIAVDAAFLPPLLEHFRDDRVFAVNPQVFQADGEMPGGGLVRGYFHFGLLRLRWSDSHEQRARPWLTLYANGAATAMDRRKFLELGGFDPLYAPFYSEDLDVSYRAYQRGWEIRYEPRSTMRHEHGATIKRYARPGYISRISKRNRILFVWRNIRDPRLLLGHAACTALRTAGAALTFDAAFLGALRDAFSRLPEVLARRRQDPHMLVSDRTILEKTSRWVRP